MFFEERETVPPSVGALRAEYAADLAAAVDAAGVDAAADHTGLDPATLEAVLAAGDGGELPDLSLEEAAAVQALEEGAPDAETVVEIGCDNLLLGMSMAVLDVETLASELELDRSPKELQQKLERRAPMTFEEYVAVQHAVVGRR
jgi:hypothetical protein